MTTAFVTGGTGFVGGALLDRLRLEPGMTEVRALARDRTNGEVVRGKGAKPIMGDVRRLAEFEEALSGCDVVFHVAGVNAMCVRKPTEMFDVNVTGAANVVRAAARAGVPRVVFTSSAVTLGEARGTIGDERSNHRGSYLSAYERSKHLGEQAVKEAADAGGIDVVIVNPSSVQGPGRTTGTARLLLDMLNRRVVPAIATNLSLVDVADCAEAHVLAWRNGVPGERYVINGVTTTVRDAAEQLARVAGSSARLVYLPGWLAAAAGTVAGGIAQVSRRSAPICREMVRVLLHGHAYDGSRATRELGLEYAPLRYTLERTIAWYVEYGFVRRALPNFPKP